MKKIILITALMILCTMSSNAFELFKNDYYNQAKKNQDEYVDEFASAYKNGKWGFVNSKNEFVVPAIYTYTQNAPGNYFFACKDEMGEKCAYVSKKDFRRLTDFLYLGGGNAGVSEDFSEGLAKVIVVDKKGKWKTGYINKNWVEVITPKFDYGTAFKDGVAEVSMDGKKFLIDKKGNYIKQEKNEVKK